MKLFATLALFASSTATFAGNSVEVMCTSCLSEPSDACWGACYSLASRSGTTVHDAVVVPQCTSCLSEPSDACWGACYSLGTTFSNDDIDSMCTSCLSEPSDACWGACARSTSSQFAINKDFVKMVQGMKGQSRCTSCLAEPSDACWGAC
ncbi:unnamed protein product [Oikopleura dioica]|uniref:Snake toxin/toxin-like domain-containing protein n=1 Tax=Oikopleura dioica TaxID=34765 RepID=E4WYN3_OIKDI|nr:unnamed protein product [Oikopleura dioica]CBY37085.1 unnamed protein product [Oikopleura dioica]